MIDLVELKKRIEFHLDDRDAAEYTGSILPDSLDAISELEAKIAELWEENVRRREAIEKHRRAMEEERIASYYFDRELWSVLGEGEGDAKERGAKLIGRAREDSERSVVPPQR